MIKLQASFAGFEDLDPKGVFTFDLPLSVISCRSNGNGSDSAAVTDSSSAETSVEQSAASGGVSAGLVVVFILLTAVLFSAIGAFVGWTIHKRSLLKKSSRGIVKP